MGRKKTGRNKDKCKLYSSSGTREKNKKRKLIKHFHNGKNANDQVAKTALNKL